MLTSCCSLIATLTDQTLKALKAFKTFNASKMNNLPETTFLYSTEFDAYTRRHPNAGELRAKLAEDNPDVVERLRDYLDSVEVLKNANQAYSDHMLRSRRDLTVAELLEYRVHQDLLYEQTEYASWLTCWAHHELQAEVLGRDVVTTEFPPYRAPQLYEDEDDPGLRWEWTPYGWVA